MKITAIMADKERIRLCTDFDGSVQVRQSVPTVGPKPGRTRFEWRWTMPCVGVLLAAADWLYFRGLAFPEAPISVGSLLRRVSVVLTFVLGARAFHETNLARKALAMAVILAGVALLCT